MASHLVELGRTNLQRHLSCRFSTTMTPELTRSDSSSVMSATSSTSTFTESSSSLALARISKSVTSKSSASSSLSLLNSWQWCGDDYPDVVRMIILNGNYDHVCMVMNREFWDFPTFQYEDNVSRGRALGPCYADLRTWLGDKWKNMTFWFTLDFNGKYFFTREITPPWRTVRSYAYFVEFIDTERIDELDLPEGSAWIDLKGLKEIIEKPGMPSKGLMLRVGASMFSLQQTKSIISNLTDPRQQLGWHGKAVAFLTEAACKDGAEITGNVEHHHLTATSTILKVETSEGWYFLKSPVVGCNEVEVTSTVVSLFPDLAAPVVAWSKALNCFVSPPFTDVSPYPDDLNHVARNVARLHHRSRRHVEYLAKKGLPIRDMKSLIHRMEGWINGEGVMEEDSFSGTETRNLLKALLLLVRRVGKGLNGSNLPMTLVHGDLEVDNLTHEPGGDSEDPNCLLFDWQYAYIGYPFCEFYQIRPRMPEKCIDQYLRTWNRVMGLNRARALFERLSFLGRFFKLMSLGEWYEASRGASASDTRAVFCKHVETYYNNWVVEKHAFNSSRRRSL